LEYWKNNNANAEIKEELENAFDESGNLKEDSQLV
jgi:hypothetical protein